MLCQSVHLAHEHVGRHTLCQLRFVRQVLTELGQGALVLLVLRLASICRHQKLQMRALRADVHAVMMLGLAQTVVSGHA